MPSNGQKKFDQRGGTKNRRRPRERLVLIAAHASYLGDHTPAPALSCCAILPASYPARTPLQCCPCNAILAAPPLLLSAWHSQRVLVVSGESDELQIFSSPAPAPLRCKISFLALTRVIKAFPFSRTSAMTARQPFASVTARLAQATLPGRHCLIQLSHIGKLRKLKSTCFPWTRKNVLRLRHFCLLTKICAKTNNDFLSLVFPANNHFGFIAGAHTRTTKTRKSGNRT